MSFIESRIIHCCSEFDYRHSIARNILNSLGCSNNNLLTRILSRIEDIFYCIRSKIGFFSIYKREFIRYITR